MLGAGRCFDARRVQQVGEPRPPWWTLGSRVVTYIAAEARQQLLDDLAGVIGLISLALANFGEAYEQLDDASADRLEAVLFRPVQVAYGRAQRTHAAFASRHKLPGRSFSPRSPGGRPHDARGAIDRAVEAIGSADDAIAGLLDSGFMIDVGDPELRAGLTEIRVLLGDLRLNAREFVRRLGR
jgi:hypothetical protein